MKTKRVLAVLCASLLAGPALAGINPADPGLPVADTTNNAGTSSYTGFTAPNNQASAMCVDCHTVQPKAGGSHYVNATSTAGATNSGGSGIDNTGAIATRDNGAYFKVSLWNANGSSGAPTYSKYRNGSNLSVVPDNTVAGVTTATTDATVGNYANYDIICESCHNIVINDAGGNNLLETQANNEWEDADVAALCVGCHGFMYTDQVDQSASGLANWSDPRNSNEVAGTGRKGNNEYHWVKGVARPQNHHVMTGDVINSTQAGLMVLWTDNDVVSYTDEPIDNGSTKGTYPQKTTWDNGLTKPTSGGLNCTNCHAPAHGQNASPGASILRNATYTTASHALGPIARISDRGGWKKIDDLAFCGQCHQ